jgi:hypothetical protein
MNIENSFLVEGKNREEADEAFKTWMLTHTEETEFEKGMVYACEIKGEGPVLELPY